MEFFCSNVFQSVCGMYLHQEKKYDHVWSYPNICILDILDLCSEDINFYNL